MRTNKFSIGGLRGGIYQVNEVIKTISNPFNFFYEKFLKAQKRKKSQNQPKKQKQANKNQQMQQFFAHKSF